MLKLPLASVALMSTMGLQQEAVYATGTFDVVPAMKLVRNSTPTGLDVTLMSPGIKSNTWENLETKLCCFCTNYTSAVDYQFGSWWL